VGRETCLRKMYSSVLIGTKRMFCRSTASAMASASRKSFLLDFTNGFQPVGHIVFRKSYSSKSRFLRYQHEQVFPLAKGRPPLPKQPLGDVMDMPYSGNKLHPTQKPVPALAQLIRSFSLPGESVLDPFAGSGSTCAAALLTGRKYIGMETDDTYFQHAIERLQRVHRGSPQSGPQVVAFPRGCDVARVPVAPQGAHSSSITLLQP
jgi:hypothetical protein